MKPLRDTDPRQIGPYALHGVIGRGGMGTVYLGQTTGGHRAAVKLVHSHLADDEAFRRRFAKEVGIMRRVGGYFAAHLVDSDTHGDSPWMATSYIQGVTLQSTVEQRGVLPATTVLRLAAGLAEGLRQAHDADVVHRDVKPANVMLSADGPKLLDFGIAQALDATAYTRSHQLGTPGYMSPEQALGDSSGPPSDIFSLGSTLAFAATGTGLFGEGNGLAVAGRVARYEINRSVLDGLPVDLRDLIMGCLAREPGDRPGPDRIIERAGSQDDRPGDWLPRDVAELVRQHDAGALAATHDPRPQRPSVTSNAPDRPRTKFASPREKPQEWRATPERATLGVLTWIAMLAVLCATVVGIRLCSLLAHEILPAQGGIIGFLLSVTISFLLPAGLGILLFNKLSDIAGKLLPVGRRFDAITIDEDHLLVSRTRTTLPDIDIPWQAIDEVWFTQNSAAGRIKVRLRADAVPDEKQWARDHRLYSTDRAHEVTALAGWPADRSSGTVNKLHDALKRCAGAKYVTRA